MHEGRQGRAHRRGRALQARRREHSAEARREQAAGESTASSSATWIPPRTPCVDFTGYVNGKWLAANKIPGDRTSWGAFEMLDERSTAVQKPARRAGRRDAATPPAWTRSSATSMPPAWTRRRSTPRASTPLKGSPGRDRRGSTARSRSPTTCAPVAAQGENFLFGFGAEADFKDSKTRTSPTPCRAAWACRIAAYYFDADKKDKLAAYEQHVAKVLELSGVPAADAAQQAKDVIAFETRLAQGVQVQRGDVARRRAVLQPGQPGRRRQADAELPVDAVLRVAGRGPAEDVLAGDPGLPPGGQQDAGRRAGRAVAELPALPHRG